MNTRINTCADERDVSLSERKEFHDLCKKNHFYDTLTTRHTTKTIMYMYREDRAHLAQL